jgi:hypothetical protein
MLHLTRLDWKRGRGGVIEPRRPLWNAPGRDELDVATSVTVVRQIAVLAPDMP